MSILHTFYVDAVLFDMDGTLTDSISAVEAAWGKVACDIGQNPEYVIAATHGKRAIDNLAKFKPYIKSHEMDDEVTNFENTILYFADAYNLHGPGSRQNSVSNTPYYSPVSLTPADSGAATPILTPESSASSSRASSIVASQVRRPSFSNRLHNMLRMSHVPEDDVRIRDAYHVEHEDAITDELDAFHQGKTERHEIQRHAIDAWKLEAANIDRSVRILPGVKKLIDSIPADRYAVATSGAKTYAYGCMTRVGITPPPVTITADDKRLKAGKPAPDPFLLAAKCLGYDATKCVVFEDSPNGIRAGVASGATVVALCTSHERSKIDKCGAHFILDNMEQLRCETVDNRLKFTIFT